MLNTYTDSIDRRKFWCFTLEFIGDQNKTKIKKEK